MNNCLFCRIVSGSAPARRIYSDDEVFAFHDLNPQAPLHALIVPRKHVPTINDLTEEDDGLVGAMFRRAAVIAREHGYDQRGYRTVLNCNREAGQSVYHIHLHVLGGRRFAWPPG